MQEQKPDFIFQVEKQYENLRLELWLQTLVPPEYSRSLIQKWIQKNNVHLISSSQENVEKYKEKNKKNKKHKLKKGRKIKVDEIYAIYLPQEKSQIIPPIDIPFDILYEDDFLAVIHKPTGLAVHPGPNQKDSVTLLNGLIYKWPQIASPKSMQETMTKQDFKIEENFPLESHRLGIVHRLDKDTEGLLIVAKTLRAQLACMALFKERKIEKTYIAWTRGRPYVNTKNESLKERQESKQESQQESQPTIEGAILVNLPISRHPKYRWKKRVDIEGGKEASMLYKVLKTLTLPAKRRTFF